MERGSEWHIPALIVDLLAIAVAISTIFALVKSLINIAVIAKALESFMMTMNNMTMMKIADKPYNIAYDHRPIVREIRLNRAYELFRQSNENKPFSRQSGLWHDETARGFELIELASKQ